VNMSRQGYGPLSVVYRYEYARAVREGYLERMMVVDPDGAKARFLQRNADGRSSLGFVADSNELK
jgi:hypothetical protein